MGWGLGLWSHAKERFLCMWKGIHGGSDPHTPPFILSKNQVKPNKGSSMQLKSIHLAPLRAQNPAHAQKHTGDAGGSVPVPCHPRTLGSPVGQHGRSFSHRGSASAKQARRERRPKAGRRRGRQRTRGRPGPACQVSQTDSSRKGPSPHAERLVGSLAMRPPPRGAQRAVWLPTGPTWLLSRGTLN